jgi:hypothetical protein
MGSPLIEMILLSTHKAIPAGTLILSADVYSIYLIGECTSSLFPRPSSWSLTCKQNTLCICREGLGTGLPYPHISNLPGGPSELHAFRWKPDTTGSTDVSGAWECGAVWEDKGIQTPWAGVWTDQSIAAKERATYPLRSVEATLHTQAGTSPTYVLMRRWCRYWEHTPAGSHVSYTS